MRAVLPPAAPSWLTSRRIALAAIALGAGAAALPSVWWIAREVLRTSAAGQGILVATTMGLAARVGHVAARQPDRAGAVLRAVVSGAGYGILNAGLGLAGVALAEGAGLSAAAAFLAGCAFGVPVGIPLGVAYGVAFSPLVCAAVDDRRVPSHDAADRMLVRAGGWLLAVAAGAALVAPEARLAAGAAVAAFVGVAAVVVGAVRLTRWRAWLARVQRGEIPEYRVVEHDAPEAVAARAAGEIAAPLSRRLLDRGSSAAGDTALLVHLAGVGAAAPYRGAGAAGAHVGVALVPRGRRRA